MAQFPFDVLDADWPRPRLVRCVSCVMTVVLTAGAFDADVGADAEADAEEATAGGAGSEPEYTLARRSAAAAAAAEVAGLAGGRTEEGDLGAGTGEGRGPVLDDEPVAAETTDVSMRAARLDILSAAVCKLRKLFDCCESCGDTELLMLEIDSGRGCCCCGSLWRVRMIDNFRRMTLPSESKYLIGCCFCCCREPGEGVTPPREMDELECVGSGSGDARERLNGDKTL
jgi:hypothetical protein